MGRQLAADLGKASSKTGRIGRPPNPATLLYVLLARGELHSPGCAGPGAASKAADLRR
jgi:hypothetical protein